jgi:ethanolamine transporter EutH
VTVVTTSSSSGGLVAFARRVRAVCGAPANLRRTIPIALVVGTLLTAINQLDVFVSGKQTAFTFAKVGLNFLVPFCVSNLGVLTATKAARKTTRV